MLDIFSLLILFAVRRTITIDVAVVIAVVRVDIAIRISIGIQARYTTVEVGSESLKHLIQDIPIKIY